MNGGVGWGRGRSCHSLTVGARPAIYRRRIESRPATIDYQPGTDFSYESFFFFFLFVFPFFLNLNIMVIYANELW